VLLLLVNFDSFTEAMSQNWPLREAFEQKHSGPEQRLHLLEATASQPFLCHALLPCCSRSFSFSGRKEQDGARVVRDRVGPPSFGSKRSLGSDSDLRTKLLAAGPIWPVGPGRAISS